MLTILEGSRDDRHVYWVGSPILQEKRKDTGVQQVNAVARRVVEQHPHATYVDAYTLFADADGTYAASLPDETGKVVRVRAGDGVHLTDAGGDRLADAGVRPARPALRRHRPRDRGIAEDRAPGRGQRRPRRRLGWLGHQHTIVGWHGRDRAADRRDAPRTHGATRNDSRHDDHTDTTPEPPVDPPVEPSLPT